MISFKHVLYSTALVSVLELAPTAPGIGQDAELGDLRKQVQDLRDDVAAMRGDVEAATIKGKEALATANHALASAQAGQSCCDSTHEKLDRMFRKSTNR
jgi:hypothetical protein